MNLKINYERLLTLDKINLIETKVGKLKVNKSKNKINKVSLQHVIEKRHEKKISSKLGIPTEPIIINDVLEVATDFETKEIDKPKEKIQLKEIEEPKLYNDNKLVALTFDDGPNANTNSILDVLKEYDSKATFFITGSKIENNKNEINRINDEGHQIGNHGFNHIPFTNLSFEEIGLELSKTHNLLINMGINSTSKVRPPFGKLNESIKVRMQQPVLLWNIDSQDTVIKNNRIIINNIKKQITDGSIILMHELPSTPELLRILIFELQEEGYEFVTIDNLCKQKQVKLMPGKVYAKVKRENNIKNND